MQEKRYQEQIKSRVLTDDECMDLIESAARTVKQEIANRSMECDAAEVAELRAQWRVVDKMLNAVREEVFRDE